MSGRGIRVAYVAEGIAPSELGGMQAVARMHIEGLARRGAALEIIRPSVAASDCGSLPGRLHTLPWPAHRGLRGRLPGHYAGELRRFSQGVDEILQRLAVDVVYAEGPVVDALLQRPRAERPPVLFHPHGLEPFQDLGRARDNLRSLPLRSILRRHAQRAECVLSQGGHLTGILTRSCGAPPERVVTLPNALPGEWIREGDAERRGPARFLFVGRDEPRKGLRHLLEAFEAVEGAELHIVGPSPRTAAGRGLEALHWHGVVRSPEAMRAIYDDSHYLVLPSLAEGMPTVLLESMARGLPVIATDVGAVPEVIRDASLGWLVERKSVPALRQALAEAAAQTPEAYGAMSRAVREAARLRFAEGPVVDRLLDQLRKLAGAPPSEAVASC